MKKFIFLASILFAFGFADSEKVIFKSTDGKTKITANDWADSQPECAIEVPTATEKSKKSKKNS